MFAEQWRWVLLLPLLALLFSQNHLGWKGPLISWNASINPALPSPPLSHIPECHICTGFKCLQRWQLHHYLGQQVPVSDYPCGEETFPINVPWCNLQPFPLVLSLERRGSLTTDIQEVLMCYRHFWNVNLSSFMGTKIKFVKRTKFRLWVKDDRRRKVLQFSQPVVL